MTPRIPLKEDRDIESELSNSRTCNRINSVL